VNCYPFLRLDDDDHGARSAQLGDGGVVQDGATVSAVYAEKTPVERFMSFLATVSASRDDGPSWALYERLKRDFVRQCPGATQSEYEQAMRAIARAAGV